MLAAQPKHLKVAPRMLLDISRTHHLTHNVIQVAYHVQLQLKLDALNGVYNLQEQIVWLTAKLVLVQLQTLLNVLLLLTVTINLIQL